MTCSVVMINRLLKIAWVTIAILIFVYSYGFVDFNLTLSSNTHIYNFVTWSQQLAMFDRGASTYVYLSLIFSLFALYLITLKTKISSQSLRFPWKFIILLSLIFSLAYPFLSSDVFKYLFVGKIIAFYHANPYLITPQEFEGDLWLRFMRWIHTTTPYGPVFSALAVPYYYLSLGKFVPMLYMFKLDQAAWYLLTIWLIGKLAGLINKDQSKIVASQLFFALNPLVLVEWLVNAHNDAIMITLLLLSIYLLAKGKRALSFLSLLFSIGIKFVTVIALPFVVLNQKLFNKYQKLIYLFMLVVLFLAPLLYHYAYQYQPWYVTWLVPIAAILGIGSISYLVTAYTLGAFLRYLPFIGIGLWEGTSTYFAVLTFGPLIISGLYLLFLRGKNQL